MEESKTEIKKLERGLINPHQGRAYLRTALAQDDEQVLLGALHEIIDSLINFELDDKSTLLIDKPIAISCYSDKNRH